jgi:hypothetical protein
MLPHPPTCAFALRGIGGLRPRASPQRAGSLLVFVLGLTAIAVTLAFTFLSSAKLRREQGLGDGLRLLSQEMAREGTAHAIAFLQEDFLRSGRRPASLGSNWRQAFGPIDGHLWRRGDAPERPATWFSDFPDNLAAENLNENDVKMEEPLPEQYQYTREFAEGLQNPYSSHDGAWTYARPMSRYFEAGSFHRDLVGKPISFDLTHPQATERCTVLENYVPDLDAPIYYDERLRPVATRELARYRLRYAIWADDLESKLLMSAQGPYLPPANTAPASIPTTADEEGTREMDLAVANGYLHSNVQMELIGMTPVPLIDPSTSQPPNLQYRSPSFANCWWLGIGHDYGGSSRNYGPLAKFVGTAPWFWGDKTAKTVAADYNPVVFDSEPNWIFESQFPGSSGDTSYISGRGPRYSFADDKQAGNVSSVTYLSLTPFQRTTRLTPTPTGFADGYTDTPWQVNLLTAPRPVIQKMFWSLMPKEVWTWRYGKRYHDDRVAGTWTNRTDTHNLYPYYQAIIDLYSAPKFSPIFAYLGTRYPGTTTTAYNPTPTSLTKPARPAGLPAAEWNQYLGSASNINEWWTSPGFTCPPGLDGARWDSGRGMANAYPPLQNTRSSFLSGCPVGSLWGTTYEPPSANVTALTTGRIVEDDNNGGFLNWDNGGYWNSDSYWLDIAQGFLMTVALAQYAHQPFDGRQTAATPAKGRPLWPTVPGDTDYTGKSGLPMLDTDLDGDGVNDSPSLLNSIPKIDRQFIKNMGEYPEAYATGTRPTAAHYAVYCARGTDLRFLNVPYVRAWQPSATIKSMCSASGGANTPEQAALMEMVLNDIRLSLFGSSGQYPDFSGIDFDDNGTVRCSGYTGGQAAADPSTGYGPIVPAAQRFSLTGSFVLRQARFFRLIVRGEVYDCLLRTKATADCNLETVYAIDPLGAIYDVSGNPIPANRDPNSDGNFSDATSLNSSRVLMQRWIRNHFQGTRSRTYP